MVADGQALRLVSSGTSSAVHTRPGSVTLWAGWQIASVPWVRFLLRAAVRRFGWALF